MEGNEKNETVYPRDEDMEEAGESIMIEIFGKSPKTRIIDLFVDNPLYDFTKKEAIGDLEMSKRTFYKYFPEIKEMGIVKPTRKIGRAQLYKLNLDNTIVKKIMELEEEVSHEYAEKELEKMKELEKEKEEQRVGEHKEKIQKKKKAMA